MAALVRDLQQQNRDLAGLVGSLQQRLTFAEDRIRALQAPAHAAPDALQRNSEGVPVETAQGAIRAETAVVALLVSAWRRAHACWCAPSSAPVSAPRIAGHHDVVVAGHMLLSVAQNLGLIVHDVSRLPEVLGCRCRAGYDRLVISGSPPALDAPLYKFTDPEGWGGPAERSEVEGVPMVVVKQQRAVLLAGGRARRG